MRVMLLGWEMPVFCCLMSALRISLPALLLGGGDGRFACALSSCVYLLVAGDCFTCGGCVNASGSMEGEGEGGGAVKLRGGRTVIEHLRHHKRKEVMMCYLRSPKVIALSIQHHKHRLFPASILLPVA